MMKQKVAILCLVMATGCLVRGLVAGQAPDWFSVAAAFAMGATVLGYRWIRISGALLVAASVVFAALGIYAAHETKVAQQELQRNLQANAVKTTEFRRKLLAISTEDGISKSEAEIIAECYFDKHVACGAFTGIRDGGDYWIVDGAFGFAGRPIKGFHIDKSSGKVTSPIGPSYATPFQILP